MGSGASACVLSSNLMQFLVWLPGNLRKFLDWFKPWQDGWRLNTCCCITMWKKNGTYSLLFSLYHCMIRIHKLDCERESYCHFLPAYIFCVSGWFDIACCAVLCPSVHTSSHRLIGSCHHADQYKCIQVQKSLVRTQHVWTAESICNLQLIYSYSLLVSPKVSWKKKR